MPLFRLSDRLVFPPVHLAEPEGLLAVGGDLSPERLLAAYRSGIFPWYSEGEPILWWSPDPRMILFPEQFHRSHSLEKTIRRQPFCVQADMDFEQVITRCATVARAGQKGTWITKDMMDAYLRLHALGYAHSIECRRDERLVGGLYGVSLGGCFFGESMFSLEKDASKAAFAALARHCLSKGVPLIDCQNPTPHLARLGGRAIPRAAFIRLLQSALRLPTHRGVWTIE